MAYRVDQVTGDLVIDGFEQGIGSDPYSGLLDLRNINITSVPGEASVNFATNRISSGTVASIVVTGGNGGGGVGFNATAGLENGMCIKFTQVGGLTGATVGTPYWVYNTAGSPAASCNFYATYSDYNTHTNAITIGGAVSGSPTFTAYVMNQPTYFSYATAQGTYWVVDKLGQVWSNTFKTVSGYWTYTGNLVPTASSYTSGNGLVYYETSGGTGYLFVFHNGSIDYTQTGSGSISWNYQWNPNAGTVGVYSASPSSVFLSGSGYTGPHMALVGQDNVVYICDRNFLQSFFEKSSQTFNPLSTATYTTTINGAGYFALQIPIIDQANCLAELGTSLLVGGQRNLIYPWDRTSTNFSYPIFLSENVVANMVTVNTNTYLFVGNRGNIYITNGTQANLWKKVPDHISGTVEPYFTWGGATYVKNQLYFSFWVTSNNGTAISNYGGIWGIDLGKNEAMRLTNQLSYGNYAGFASCLISINPSALLNIGNPAGIALYAGWANNVPAAATTYGVDAPFNPDPAVLTSSPYSGGQAIVVSEMIPTGTLLQPTTPQQFEFKLMAPLLANESVELQVGSTFADYVNNTFTSLGTTRGSNSSTIISDIFPSKVQNQQWLILKAILSASTIATPSYNRLRELRVKGATTTQTSYPALQ